MSVAAYAEYKDGGVEWLGAVPAHWDVCALNYRFEIDLGKMLDEKRITGDHLGPYLRNTDVQWGRVNTEDLPLMDFSGADLTRYALLKGDLLVCEGGEIGRAAVWDGQLSPCFYQKALHRLRPRRPDRDCPRFTLYLFSTAAKLGVFAGGEGRSTIAHLPAETLRRYRMCFPPPHEQTAIASFLDRETGKIDALVEEQRRLIALLKEKRQAVISHAVTKGLDPTAPMKDSGVEWLGKVPANWDVAPLKWLTPPDRAIMYGIVLPGPDVGKGIPIVKGGDVKPGRLSLDQLCWTTPEIEAPFARARLRPNDIVYSIRGAIGDAELVPDGLTDANITQDVARISPIDDGNFRWLLSVMRSQPIFAQLEQRSMGAAVRGINICDLKRAQIPVPPPAEQDAIATFLDDQIGKLSDLQSEAEAATKLLQERRAALISAAVTGKIDVRGMAHQLLEVA